MPGRNNTPSPFDRSRAIRIDIVVAFIVFLIVAVVLIVGLR